MKHNYIKNMLAAMLLLCSTVASAYDFEVGGIYYDITNATAKTVQVVSSGDNSKYSGNVVIPDKVTYYGTYSVTSIGYEAFYNCSGLTSVTIPNSVTSISRWAFFGCSGLTAVHISDLAAWCKINFGVGASNPLSYAHNLYLNGEKVTNLVIPSGITDIKQYAFSGCTGLTSVTIPNSVTSIGNDAFEGCSGLTSVTIPGSVTSIEYSAFGDCSGLTSITVNSGNSVYDSRKGCNAIIETATNTLIAGCNNTIIPGSVTSIGSYAFQGCSGLTSVTIPSSVTSIGSWAFEYCTGLTSVTIPNSVTNIDGGAFKGCSGLTSVTIPNSVKSIEESAFEGCTGLTSVTIPNSVTSIGDYAFDGCSGLTSVTIPNSVTSIGGYAFRNCTGLTSIEIPNSVTSIVCYAFAHCSGLTSVTIPNSVKSIDYGAFYDCSGLTSVTIPNSVTGIDYGTFYGCSGLTSVTIPNSVKSIEESAFEGCTGLTSITIPNSVTSIGERAFYGCSGLTSITIPNSVTSIGSYAFYGCSGLTSITIPNSVTSIGERAFYDCSSLKTVYNCSSLNICKGWSNNGYVAWYADEVITAPYGYIEGDFVFERKGNFTTADGLPGTDIGSNYIWESPVINCSTNGVLITVLATNVSDSYNGYPIVALGELEFYDGNGNKIAYSASNVTTNSLESTEGSLAGLCDGDYSTYYHSTWWNGTTPDDYVYLDIKFPQTVDAFKIKMVGRDTKRCVPTEIQVTPGKYSLLAYIGNDTALVLPENCNGENYVIGSNVFRNNTAITSVTIPGSVTSIGDNAFSGCTNLKTVYNCSSLNIVAGSTDNGYVAYYADKVINANGSTIVTQGDYRFTTANGVNTLVDYTGNATSLVLPVNFNGENYTIGADAFINNTAITSVTIPGSVTSIGDRAFLNCTSLKTVYNNSSLDIVPRNSKHGYVAYYADEVITVNADGSSAVTQGEYKFTIANGVNTLVGYTGNDTALVLPENFNGENYTIGADAFKNNTAITSVTIPTSVTSIGDNAFYGCTNLKTVTNKSSLNIVKGSTENGYVANYADKVITVNADGSSAVTQGEYKFTIANGVNTLVGYTGNDTALVLPENFNGESYAIGNSVFAQTAITSVTIPAGVTSIGSNAFYGCTNLKTVTNKSSLNIVKGSTENGYVANYADKVITVNADGSSAVTQGEYKFTIANGVNTLVGYTGNDTALVLPENYNGESYVIGADAFKNNTAITSVTIPAGVTRIGEGAFSGCSGLTSVTIPDGVTSIGNTAFYGCTGLTSVKLGKNVTSLGAYAFQYCTSLNDITLPSSLKRIGMASLSHCGFTNVVIPDNVKTIDDYAFDYCENLAQVTIGNSVTSIGDYAFDGCTNLKTVTNKSNLDIVAGSENHGRVAFYADKVINANGNNYVVINDCLFKMESDGNCTLIRYTGTGGTVTLPGTCEGKSYTIAADVFKNNTAITGVIISEGVTAIPESIFEGCSNLTSLVIPNSLTSIGNKAFEGINLHRLEINTTTVGGIFNGCTSLKEIVFGEGVKTIEDNSFIGCTGLTSVTVGINVEYIGQHSFKDSKVAKVFWLTNIPPTNYELFNGMINYVSNEEYTMLSNVQVSKFLSSMFEIDGIVYVPLALTATNRTCGIVDFRVCDGVENIVACDTVTYSNVKLAVTDIMPYSFWENDTVTTVSLRNSGFIGTSAFEGCGKISEITIPTSITSIGNYAFRNCAKLTDAVIADSINKKLPLGAKIFDNSALDSLYIGCKIEYINEPSETASPFSSNKTLRTVVITDAESDIYDYEFFDCSNLRSIVVGDGVEDIGRWAFSKCVNLEKFAFGSNVSTIGEEAFSDCARVTNITSRAILPPVCGSQALEDIIRWNCTLIVPEKYLYAYTTADQWESFFNIEKLISDDRILTFEIDGEIYKMLLVTPGKTIIPPYVEDKNGISITWRNLKDYPTMPDADITIYGSFGLPGDVNGDAVVNVSDFAALANIILEIYPETDSADVNGDAVVNVSDFAALANIILNTSASNAAPKKAAATTRSSVESSLTIEPFSICPGEEVEVEVLMENPGVEISQIEFELTLPTGIEIVYDDENECDMVDVGSRTTYKNHTVATNKLGDNTTKIMCTSQKNKTFKNESGDVLIIVVRATDAFTAANAEFSITNTVLGLPDGETYLTPADYTGVISNTTGIDEIMSEQGTLAVYTLAGVKVMETTDANDVKSLPAGLYIINGKKVVVE